MYNVDQQLAMFLMGWSILPAKQRIHGNSGLSYWHDVYISDGRYVRSCSEWNPSTSWEDMGCVLEEMKKIGFHYDICSFGDWSVTCTFRKASSPNIFAVEATQKTIQEAVASAAITAIMHGV